MSQTRRSSAPPRPARRVLVVDDNVDAADLLAEALAGARYEVRVAYDGESALATALEMRPDAALLDLGMPDVDGCTVATRLRATKGLERVLLWAITGDGDAEHRRRALAAGFDVVLLKPIDLDSLEAELAQRLAR